MLQYVTRILRGDTMSFQDVFCDSLMKKFDIDKEEAKFCLRLYIARMKFEVEESDDERKKELWHDEFGDVEYPTIEAYLTTVCIFGRDPFKSKDGSGVRYEKLFPEISIDEYIQS